MANFELQKNYLEGILNNQLNSARQTQGAWEWFNALYRIISSVRLAGNVTVFGPKQLAAGTNVVETVPVTLYGVLGDNSQAAEDCWIQLSNVVATPGTTDIIGALFVPRATMRFQIMAEGAVHAARLEVFSTGGTNALLEAGTASSVQPTVVLVYTK